MRRWKLTVILAPIMVASFLFGVVRCAATRQIASDVAGGAVNGAVDKADERIGEAIYETILGKDSEFAAELAAEVDRRRAAGEKTPWIKTILSHLWGIIFVILFGRSSLKLRKLTPLKAVSEVLSLAIERVKSDSPATADKLTEAITEAATRHPGIPNGTRVRAIMSDSGAKPAIPN